MPEAEPQITLQVTEHQIHWGIQNAAKHLK